MAKLLPELEKSQFGILTFIIDLVLELRTLFMCATHSLIEVYICVWLFLNPSIHD